jgi:hypothetical protein
MPSDKHYSDEQIDVLIKEVGEREAKATPGPYLVVYNGNSLMSIATDYENRAGNENVAMSPLLPYGRRTYFQAHERQSLTFEFLAHSRSDIPFLLTVIAQLRQQRDEARKDTERLDFLETKEAALISHREKFGDGQFSIWWNVVKRGKSLSGHPLGHARDAIDAALPLPAASERKTP